MAMAAEPNENLLRLGKRYSRDRARSVDVERILAAQSPRGALLGALLASAVLTVLWVYGCLLFDQFFPWFSVAQGFFIGRAVRHFGLGVDWRFPLIAAAAAVAAAFIGSFTAALFLTAREFGAPALSLVGEISWHTISTFANREFGAIGTTYAGLSAVTAGFFANRRLDRFEAVALRKHREGRPA